MESGTYRFFNGKVIIRLRDRVCDTAEKLLSSPLFGEILKRGIKDLSRRNSRLLHVFDHREISDGDIRLLLETLKYLTKIPGEHVMKIVPGSEQFFRDPVLFNDFVEYFYNYWRNFQRLIIVDSEGDQFDQRPYRTFHNTIETLTHLVRGTYRDVQENITGDHPRIYRQVRSGAEIAAIALPKSIPYPRGPNDVYGKLASLPVIRQVLIYPPLIFSPPMNKRKGVFERVYENPLEKVYIHRDDWLCYPAKVGELVIMIYFHIRFFELGFALCNLFEMANDEDCNRKPDAIYLYGTDEVITSESNGSATIFYDDEENDILVATVPGKDDFGYFGYLKKMVLTLHNIRMMKLERMPYHGAMFSLLIRDKGAFNVLVMGDTGAGKSETLEAMRVIGSEDIEDIIIIADDMGSLKIDPDGTVLGYGTETGAFVRLDDLQPGYAFGQIDRTIIMSPAQVNARVVIPVTTFHNVIKGYPVDLVLYANNYEEIDEDHPIIQRFSTPEEAMNVFREGTVMSKGTTTTTGLVHTYFANIFGPQQYRQLHEVLARDFFEAFFAADVFVGQFRTRLGVPGMERQGPEDAARALLALIKNQL